MNVGQLNYNTLFTIIEWIIDNESIHGISKDVLDTLNVETGAGINLEVTSILKNGMPIPKLEETYTIADRMLAAPKPGAGRYDTVKLGIPLAEHVDLANDGTQNYRTESGFDINYRVSRDSKRDTYTNYYNIQFKPEPKKENDPAAKKTTA
jgi:hypothetical protein